jgi:hypothetical protein
MLGTVILAVTVIVGGEAFTCDNVDEGCNVDGVFVCEPGEIASYPDDERCFDERTMRAEGEP